MTRLWVLGVAAMVALVACSTDAVVDVEGDLRAAIAVARPGTTLRLAGNEFQGPVVIDKPLRLIGSQGTVIVASPDSPAVTIRHTESVTLSNLAIRGGDSGVFIRSSVDVVLEGIRITEA
ncbi:MAG: hypothetical protein V3S62_07295, partial [Acidimicrobiia bacterium]